MGARQTGPEGETWSAGDRMCRVHDNSGAYSTQAELARPEASGGAATRPVAAGLLTVAAHAHRAPAPRAILRLVVEDPLAVLGWADLQPLPGALRRRGGDGSEDAGERGRHPAA